MTAARREESFEKADGWLFDDHRCKGDEHADKCFCRKYDYPGLEGLNSHGYAAKRVPQKKPGRV